MTNIIHNESAEYSIILELFQLEFSEEGPFLQVGNISKKSPWIIYLSARTSHTSKLLSSVIPVLKEKQFPFLLIRSTLSQFKLNGGGYGFENIGKVISIFPKSEREAVELALVLTNLTTRFKGPCIRGALQLGEVVFAYMTNQSKTLNHSSVPFPIPSRFKKANRKKYILNKRYIPVSNIHSSAKITIYKAINLRPLKFEWCVIKKGIHDMADDILDRDNRDRLLWEKNVLEKIACRVATPRVIDYFETDEEPYLVTTFISGESLRKKITSLNWTGGWPGLSYKSKQEMLRIFLNVLSVINNLHRIGFVHRDITDGNFIIRPDGKLSILDFEMVYSVYDRQPDPPFILGTSGFVSPEQIRVEIPTVKEDIFSLGALLLYLTTGINPKFLIDESGIADTSRIKELPLPHAILSLILTCLNPEPSDRPSLMYMRKMISDEVAELHSTFKPAVYEEIHFA